jgi:hypothetical protein
LGDQHFCLDGFESTLPKELVEPGRIAFEKACWPGHGFQPLLTPQEMATEIIELPFPFGRTYRLGVDLNGILDTFARCGSTRELAVR